MKKVKGYLSSIMIALLFANTTNATQILGDPSFSYEHCFGEAAAIESFASSVMGFSDAEAYEAGNDAFLDCVAEVDAYAKMYWSTH